MCDTEQLAVQVIQLYTVYRTCGTHAPRCVAKLQLDEFYRRGVDPNICALLNSFSRLLPGLFPRVHVVQQLRHREEDLVSAHLVEKILLAQGCERHLKDVSRPWQFRAGILEVKCFGSLREVATRRLHRI